ncbi:Acetyl-CoA synthetase-like protein [Venustampulla echinocandica]|uniref:Acetyl-CoA synthetase-like protein n=1 Tax=Venustampulla echinocandica TaxID=2656787 RepID=A0A370U1G7_9HELO|nr:Acetyl-CoA synthetase-like protein [Venustampulla echinocandica]RDL41605.1 Acetyl-CoA synthetase-like protein [Venustampulla echinocandica]
MVFSPPSWQDPLPFDPPDSIPISEFLFNEAYGRHPIKASRNPYTCGITGLTYTASEQVDRVELLARSLANEFGWHPNKGSEWDKVVGIFALNTVDSMTLSWAIHRLSGIASPANAAYSASELEYQLKNSGATSLFTCMPALDTALEAARASGIPNNRIYILDMPKQFSGDKAVPFKTVGQLVTEGARLPKLEPLKWSPGQGKRQTAFLCYSSGTSGLPKGVMISHRNVIANVMQYTGYESKARRERKPVDRTEVVLGLLPLSHIYGLIVVAQVGTYRGDEVIILPKFELQSFLRAIQTYKIWALYLVPPIIITLTKNQEVCSKYNLNSVRTIFTGAAPLGAETAQDLQKIYPTWKIRQGYGLTESCTVVCGTPEHDIFFGSSGSLLPGIYAKIVSPEGVEITEYDKAGELVVQSPSVVIGYLNNDKANKETFIDDTDGKGKWMRTGDEAVVRKSPLGHEHIFIVDRIKELIKVKGLQVAPAELEAHLLTHPSVADCAVIPVPDDKAGEVPKAFVVKSSTVGIEDNDKITARSICKHVEEHKARHKWLKGGVTFIDVIPKSPSVKQQIVQQHQQIPAARNLELMGKGIRGDKAEESPRLFPTPPGKLRTLKWKKVGGFQSTSKRGE